jgi:hypothetical protein
LLVDRPQERPAVALDLAPQVDRTVPLDGDAAVAQTMPDVPNGLSEGMASVAGVEVGPKEIHQLITVRPSTGCRREIGDQGQGLTGTEHLAQSLPAGSAQGELPQRDQRQVAVTVCLIVRPVVHVTRV